MSSNTYLSKIVYLTQDDYESLSSKDPSVLYVTNDPGNASKVNDHTVESDIKEGSQYHLAYYSNDNVISGHSCAYFSDQNKKNELVLGNNLTSDNDNSTWGQLALYSSESRGTYIKAADNDTSWYTATLQAKTGTLALTSDLGSYVAKSGDTMIGPLTIKGAAADHPLVVRGIVGCNSNGVRGTTNGAEQDFYINYTGGNVQVGGQSTNTTDYFKVAYTTSSSSSSTGALVVSGGVGIGGNVHINGYLSPVATTTDNANKIINGINYYNGTSPQGHIGFGTHSTSTSACMAFYSTGTILFRAGSTYDSTDGFSAITGMKLTSSALEPTGTMNLGTDTVKWNNIYATTFYGAATAIKIGGHITDATTAHNAADYNTIKTYLVSTKMASNKPSFSMQNETPAAHDGYLIDFHWDNSGDYRQQLAVSNATPPGLTIRGKNSSTWSNWYPIITTANIGTGTTNGTIKLGGTEIAVAGLGTMAYETASNYAPLDSPEFTGTPTSVTPTTSSDNTMIATKEYVDGIVAANDAMIFKGTLDGAANTTYTPAADRGHTYKVATEGKINGEQVEIGDILICTTDNTSVATADNVNTIKNNWVIVQNNVDGAIFRGANSFVNNEIIIADSTSGKVKCSGITLSTDIPTSSSTDTKVPTAKAVWGAIEALDGDLNNTTPGSGKTLTAFSQTNGIVSATFGNISITKSQISDFNHSHGAITSDGKMPTGNRILIVDSDKAITTTERLAYDNTSYDLTIGVNASKLVNTSMYGSLFIEKGDITVTAGTNISSSQGGAFKWGTETEYGRMVGSTTGAIALYAKRQICFFPSGTRTGSVESDYQTAHGYYFNVDSITPITDNDVDLGSTSYKFKNIHSVTDNSTEFALYSATTKKAHTVYNTTDDTIDFVFD